VLPVFASLHVTQSSNPNLFDEATMKLTPIGEDLYGTLLLTYLQAAGAIETPAGKSVHLLQQSWSMAGQKAASFSGVVDFEIIGITDDEAPDAANTLDDLSSLSAFVSGMTSDIVVTNSEGALHEETDGHAQGFTGKSLDLEDFRCADGVSISLAAVCDGVEDCHQGEDELFCD
jgi:hypothetical protein